VFVPVSRPPQQRPSPEARILSQRIDALIRDFLANNPGATEMEVLQALELLRQQRQRAGGGRIRGQIAGLIGGLLVAMGLGVFMFLQTGAGAAAQIPWALVALVVGLIAVLGVVVVKRQG
jgi:hypothetical protein